MLPNSTNTVAMTGLGIRNEATYNGALASTPIPGSQTYQRSSRRLTRSVSMPPKT